MINDAATLAHALRANGMPASDQPFMGSRPREMTAAERFPERVPSAPALSRF
jgi:hypothetical protein